MIAVTVSFILGFITGFLLAIPPGPVAAYIITTSLFSGKRHGLLGGLGVAIIDFLFCIVALGAGNVVLLSAQNYIGDNPMITLIIKSVIILGMIFYALTMFLKSGEEAFLQNQDYTPTVKPHSSMFTGGFIALSNAVSPTFLPALIATVAMVTNSITLFNRSMESYLCFAIGFGAGTFLWFYIVTAFVVRHHTKFSSKVIGAMKSFTGGIIILFALYLAWRSYTPLM
jgi:threonine/homoserine/homoserine lactone efflux protein